MVDTIQNPDHEKAHGRKDKILSEMIEALASE
jgi:hypothetical protein